MISHCPSPPSNDPVLADWLISLLSGTVAAIITGLVVYGVFLGTRKTERKRAQSERTGASVAMVVEAGSAFTMMTSSVAEFRVQTFEAQKTFTHTLLAFAAREIPDHPDVANWAIQQAREFALAARPLLTTEQDATMTPAEYEQKVDDIDLPRYSARISAALMRWLRDGTDETFDPELPESFTNF